MTITFKLVALAILGFVVFNSLMTVIFGTCSWLVDRFGWKAWVVIGVLVSGIVYILYSNFGDMVQKILMKIQ